MNPQQPRYPASLADKFPLRFRYTDPMELFDTHCHLDVAEFDPDRGQVLQRARRAGVRGFIIPGIGADGWPKLLELCGREADCHPALGLHPVYLSRHTPHDVQELERLLNLQRPVAVGEIGLDYFVRELARERQQDLLEQQLALAAQFALPVLLHVRKAHDQMLSTLQRIRVSGGIAHAFNGSLQQAHKYLDLGFKLGFGGMLTFERSRKLRDLARKLPREALVLETDAPDLTVAAHRGERNSPEYLPHCLAALAEVRNEAPDLVADYTSHNAKSTLDL
jgi:TatD DNase family protein